MYNLFTISEDMIHIEDNWIRVEEIGRIGLYSPSKKSILLDYSMKWIVGTNENIPCNTSEIKAKIVELFAKRDRKLVSLYN
jgi:hypothetical protein